MTRARTVRTAPDNKHRLPEGVRPHPLDAYFEHVYGPPVFGHAQIAYILGITHQGAADAFTRVLRRMRKALADLEPKRKT